MYSNYALPLKGEEFLIDQARVEHNQKQIRDLMILNKKVGKFFTIGLVVGLLVAPNVVFADEVQRQGTRETTKRVSNAAFCAAITGTCGKAITKKISAESAANAAMVGDPRLVAAFFCGATLAWCAKYAIYDR